MFHKKKSLIFNCSDVTDASWKWIASHFDPHRFSWKFFNSAPKNFLEKKVETPSLKRIHAAWEIVTKASIDKPDLVVIHGPYLAFYVLLIAKLRRVNFVSVIYSFNFTTLPNGFKKWMFTMVFQSIDTIVVYSTFEKELYSKWFQINLQKIDMVLWAVSPPKIYQPETPIVSKNYICAIGGNARDYRTLLEAIAKCPEIPLVLVVRPENLKNLKIPPNVSIYENLDYDKTMNILKFSQFMVIPLIHSKVPCGHVTLVFSMFLNIPFVITDSAGVADYVQNGENCLTFQEGSTSELQDIIQDLWLNPQKCREMGKKGKEFAEKFCTEEVIVNHFTDLLKKKISKPTHLLLVFLK